MIVTFLLINNYFNFISMLSPSPATIADNGISDCKVTKSLSDSKILL